MKRLLSCITGLLFAGSATCHAAPSTLAEFGVNIDGAVVLFSRGDPLPPVVNLSGFDRATGLGSFLINLRVAGPHYASLFVDHELDQTVNTFFNESGAVTGSPAPGQSWEIDEPGYKFGNLFTNFVSSRLDNSNAVPAATVDDVGLALAWSFTLPLNQAALIRMTISEAVPANGFYLSQRDPESQRTIYFSSTLEVSGADTEPPTIVCPSNIVALAEPGLCYRNGVSYAVVATDNTPGVAVACTPATGTRFNVGVTPVACLATDVAGNTNGCGFTVTIRPEAPRIQCPGNIIVECTPPGGRQVSFNVAFDSPCDPNVIVRCLPPSGSTFPIGASAVNCVATNTTGGGSECGFSVFLVSTSTNCVGDYSLFKETCLAGEVHAVPLLQPYPCGICVEVTGVPADGWAFMGWLGDARGTEQTTRLTMTQNKCVDAVFGTRISIEPAPGGTAWIDPIADLYPCGTEARALARPNPGNYLVHWTNLLSGSIAPLDFTIAQTNGTVTPVFLPLPPGQFALTAETLGGGTVRGQSTRLLNRYPSGSNVVVRAIPDPSQTFLGWSIDDELAPALGTNTTISVLMNTNRSVTARFTERPTIELLSCLGEFPKGLIRFLVHGKTMATIAIEAAPVVNDPAAWHEVARATNRLGAVQYEDPILLNVPQRFYRARIVGSECPAVNLTARQEGGHVVIEWPVTECDCALLESASLSSPSLWSPVSTTPQLFAGVYRVAVSFAGGNRFYRLRCGQ